MKKKNKKILNELAIIALVIALSTLFFIVDYTFAIKEIETRFIIDLDRCSQVCKALTNGFLKW
jgi:hypothetical protein